MKPKTPASAAVAVQEVGNDAALRAVDRSVERAIQRVVLLRLAERGERVLMQAERLLRASEAAPRVGVGEIQIDPRAAELGGAARVASMIVS